MFELNDMEKEFFNEYLKLFRGTVDLKGIHSHKSTLEEIAFFPAHERRKDSKNYRKVRKKMLDQMDLPCMICGVRKSILTDENKKKDPLLNPYGAKQMEAHHHVIEWALGNAIDVSKFNSILLPNLRRKHPGSDRYKSDFSQKEMLSWIDHNEDNLWVLCDIHHRHKYFGIHAITYPVWGSQNLLLHYFEEYIVKQLLNRSECTL